MISEQLGDLNHKAAIESTNDNGVQESGCSPKLAELKEGIDSK